MLNHAILEGRVYHQRSQPMTHAFDYALNLPAIRLDDIHGFTKRSHLLQENKPGLFAFKRSDFHGSKQQTLDQAVRDTVLRETGATLNGPILLVGMLRHFGHSFNPVSFYLCFADDESTLAYIVAEITNIPWRQRHCYVLGPQQNLGSTKHHIYEFDKVFHISPFHPMAQRYRWEFTLDGNALCIHMQNIENDVCIFSATYNAEFKPATHRAINALFYKFPIASLRAIALIYYNALKLWIKKAPFFEHPDYRTQHRSKQA